MMLASYFGIGITKTLGSHRFDAAEIKAFAAEFDPQPFHLDESAAERSVFGKLCASGWHTASMWMRYNIAEQAAHIDDPWEGPGPRPEFGPSPGFRDLKWLKPVYVGDTITFTRTVTGHRARTGHPEWRVLTMRGEAFKDAGERVMQFDSAVLVKTA